MWLYSYIARHKFVYLCMKYVILTRVSTKKQVDDNNNGLGIDSQLVNCRNFVASVGGTIIKEFKEVQSASQKDVISLDQSFDLNSLLSKRPILLACIRYARQHGATLLINDVSRLTRFKLLGEYLMATGVKFQCADSPGDDNFIIGIKIALSEDYARKVASNTKKALQHKIKLEWDARGGKTWHQDINYNMDIRSGAYLVNAREKQMENARNNPNTIRAVDVISDKRDKGWNLETIAKHLNDKGYLTPRGKTWSKSQVHRMINKYCAVAA